MMVQDDRRPFDFAPEPPAAAATEPSSAPSGDDDPALIEPCSKR